MPGNAFDHVKSDREYYVTPHSWSYDVSVNLQTCRSECQHSWAFVDLHEETKFLGLMRRCVCFEYTLKSAATSDVQIEASLVGDFAFSTDDNSYFAIIQPDYEECECADNSYFNPYDNYNTFKLCTPNPVCQSSEYLIHESYMTYPECRTKECTCSTGTGATGTACPTHNTAACATCTGSRYLNNGACPAWTTCSGSQYESTSPTNTRNRVCSNKVCTCSGGTGATGTACPTHNTAKCTACTGSRYLSNGACPSWTTCSSSQYQTTSPTTTRNRVCSTKVCTCSDGTAATGTACPTHNTAKCVSCIAPYTLDGDACVNVWSSIRRVGKEPRENGNSLEEGGYRFVITDMQGVVKSIGHNYRHSFQGDMSDLTFVPHLSCNPRYGPCKKTCQPDYYCISDFEYTYPVCTSSQTQLTAPCSTETCSQEECPLCPDNTYKLKLTQGPDRDDNCGWIHYRLKVNGVYYFIPRSDDRDGGCVDLGDNWCTENSKCMANNIPCVYNENVDAPIMDAPCIDVDVSDQEHIITLPVGTQLNVVGSGWTNQYNYDYGDWEVIKWSLECNTDGTMVYNFDPKIYYECIDCKTPPIDTYRCITKLDTFQCQYYLDNPLIEQHDGEYDNGDLIQRMSNPGDIVNYCSTCSMTSFCPAHNVYSGGVCEQGVCIAGTAGSPCKECLPTTYQDQSAQTECKVCPNGWYQDQLGQSSCKTCPTNMIPLSNKLDCECISGYSGSPCTACAAGRFSSDNSCEACPNGWAQDQLGQAECEECAAGEISTGEVCSPCAAGTEPSADKTSCDQCEAGKISSGILCEYCPDSTYQDQVGQSTCKSCSGFSTPDKTSCVQNGWKERHVQQGDYNSCNPHDVTNFMTVDITFMNCFNTCKDYRGLEFPRCITKELWTGRCTEYLEEMWDDNYNGLGAYPPRLNPFDDRYDDDPIIECRNRCFDFQHEKGGSFTLNSNGYTERRCRCAKRLKPCVKADSRSGYTSYSYECQGATTEMLMGFKPYVTAEELAAVTHPRQIFHKNTFYFSNQKCVCYPPFVPGPGNENSYSTLYLRPGCATADNEYDNVISTSGGDYGFTYEYHNCEVYDSREVCEDEYELADKQCYWDGSRCHTLVGSILGCTNPLGCNFNNLAVLDDNSCILPDSIQCQSCSGETDGTGTIITGVNPPLFSDSCGCAGGTIHTLIPVPLYDLTATTAYSLTRTGANGNVVAIGLGTHIYVYEYADIYHNSTVWTQIYDLEIDYTSFTLSADGYTLAVGHSNSVTVYKYNFFVKAPESMGWKGINSKECEYPSRMVTTIEECKAAAALHIRAGSTAFQVYDSYTTEEPYYEYCFSSLGYFFNGVTFGRLDEDNAYIYYKDRPCTEHSQCVCKGWTEKVITAEGNVKSLGLNNDGTILAVGTAGAVNVYEYSNEWVETAEIQDSDFGEELAISGDGTLLAVAAPRVDTPGYVNVYRHASGWTLDDTMNGAKGFGRHLALSVDGSTLAVGNDENSIVSVYKYSDAWTKTDVVGPGSPSKPSLTEDGTILSVAGSSVQVYSYSDSWQLMADFSEYRDISLGQLGGNMFAVTDTSVDVISLNSCCVRGANGAPCVYGTPDGTRGDCSCICTELSFGVNCENCPPGYYHGEDDCEPNQCLCSNGTAATLAVCPSHGDFKCVACDAGYHLEGIECIINQCTCSGGTAGIGTDCPVHDTTMCTQCDADYYLDGVSCKTKVCTCAQGKAARGFECEVHGTEQCSQCEDFADECGCAGSNIGNSISQPNAVIATSGNVVAIAGPDKVFVYELLDEWKEEQTIPFLGAVSLSLNADGSVLAITGSPGGANCAYGYRSQGYCSNTVYLKDENGDDLPYPPLLPDDDPLYDPDRNQECMNRCSAEYGPGKGFSTKQGTGLGNGVYELYCACASDNCGTVEDPSFGPIYYSYITTCDRTVIYKKDGPTRRQIPIENPAGNYVELNNDGSVVLVVSNTHAYVYTLSRYKPLEYVQYRYQKSYQEVGLTASMSGDGKVLSVGSDTKTSVYKMMYEVKTNGDCTSPINNPEECEAAAAELGYSFLNTRVEMSSSHTGCLRLTADGDYFQFNSFFNSPVSDCGGVGNCVCKHWVHDGDIDEVPSSLSLNKDGTILASVLSTGIRVRRSNIQIGQDISVTENGIISLNDNGNTMSYTTDVGSIHVYTFKDSWYPPVWHNTKSYSLSAAGPVILIMKSSSSINADTEGGPWYGFRLSVGGTIYGSTFISGSQQTEEISGLSSMFVSKANAGVFPNQASWEIRCKYGDTLMLSGNAWTSSTFENTCLDGSPTFSHISRSGSTLAYSENIISLSSCCLSGGNGQPCNNPTGTRGSCACVCAAGEHNVGDLCCEEGKNFVHDGQCSYTCRTGFDHLLCRTEPSILYQIDSGDTLVSLDWSQNRLISKSADTVNRQTSSETTVTFAGFIGTNSYVVHGSACGTVTVAKTFSGHPLKIVAGDLTWNQAMAADPVVNIQNEGSETFTMTEPVYTYICESHPTMIGKLVKCMNELDVNQNVITVYENNPETLTGQLGEEITFAEYGFGNSIVTASQLGVTIWDEFPRLDMCRETSPPAFQTFEERNEWYPAMKMCKAVQETPFYVGTTCTTLTSDECHVAKAIISEEVDDTCSFTGSQSSLTFTGAVGSYTVEGTACGEVTVKKTFSGHPLKIVAGNLTWNESMAAVPVVSIPNTGSETFTMVEQVYTYICESHSDMIGQLVQECTQKLCKIEEECGTNGDCICGEIYEDPSCANPLQPGLCEASGGSFNRGACRLNNKRLCLETHKSFDANLECCGCGGGETRGTTKSVYHIVKDGVSECVCSEDTECDEDDEDTSMSSFIYGMLLPYVYVGKGACEDLSVVTVEGKSIPERMTYCAAACSSVGTDAFGLNNTHCVCTGHCDNDVPVDRFAFTSSYDIRYAFDEDVILQAWDSQSRHLRCFKDLERKQEVMCSHIRALKHFARGTSYRVGDCEHEAGGTTNQIPCNGRGFVVSGTCYCDYAETLDVSQTSLGIQYEPPTLLQTPYRGKHCGHFCPGYNMQDMESVCSGHGVCASTANCDCDQSFAGYKCHVQCELEPGPLTCSGHGTCEEQDADFEKDDSYKIADTIRGWDSCPEELGYLAQDRVIQIDDVIHYMFRDLSDMRYERYNVSLGEYFMWLGNAYCDMPGYTLDRLVFSSTPEEFAQACETKCVAYMGFNINFLDRKCQCIMQADVSQCNTWTDSSGDIVGTLVSDDDWQVYAKKEGDVLELQEERIASMEDYYIFGSLYRKTYGSEEPHMPCYDSVLSTREKAKSPLIDIPSTSVQIPCAVLPNYRVVCGTCKCFEHATLGHFTGYNCRTPAVGYYGARGNKVCRGMDEDSMPCNGHGTCNWGSLLGLGKQVDTQTQCFCGVVDDSVTFDTAPRNNDGEVMVHVDNLGDPLYVRTIKYANTDCSTNGFNEVLSASECREASAYMGNSWAEDVFQTAEGGCTRVGSTMYLTKNVEFETEEVVEECITSLELMDKQYSFSGIRITDAKECIIAISSLYNMTNRLQRVQRVHLDEYAPGCLEVDGVFMFNTGSGTSCGTQCVYKNDILNKIQRSFSFEITTHKEDYERFCRFDSDEFVSKEYIYVPQSGISNAAALTPLIFNEQQYYKIEDTQLVVESSSGESSFACVDHELFGVTDGFLNTHQHYEASTVEECVKVCIINGVLPTNEGALYAQFDSIQYSFGDYFDSNCNFGLGCTVRQEASTQNKCWCNKYGTEESCTSNGLLWIEADAPPDNQHMQTYTTNPPGRGISGQLVTLLTNVVQIPINLRVKDIVCYADDYCPPL